ncbi:MAG: putative membrane protein YfcA [Alphaproteobacteria bacterium]
MDLSNIEYVFVIIIFIWTGFVRSGLGFGGAALGLPLMLFVHDQALFWLPIIGLHLLFFSGLTLRTRINNIDWSYLRKAAWYIFPSAIIGVIGLIQLPTKWLLIFIYSVSLFYAVLWLAGWAIRSGDSWVDKGLLVIGGYVAGTSLTGAPLMVAVFAKNVHRGQLRNTLFVLWFILVSVKMTAFIILDVKLNVLTSALLLPFAAIGHVIGLKLHDAILKNDQLFKRFVGAMLIAVSSLGLWKIAF